MFLVPIRNAVRNLINPSNTKYIRDMWLMEGQMWQKQLEKECSAPSVGSNPFGGTVALSPILQDYETIPPLLIPRTERQLSGPLPSIALTLF